MKMDSSGIRFPVFYDEKDEMLMVPTLYVVELYSYSTFFPLFV